MGYWGRFTGSFQKMQVVLGLDPMPHFFPVFHPFIFFLPEYALPVVVQFKVRRRRFGQGFGLILDRASSNNPLLAARTPVKRKKRGKRQGKKLRHRTLPPQQNQSESLDPFVLALTEIKQEMSQLMKKIAYNTLQDELKLVSMIAVKKLMLYQIICFHFIIKMFDSKEINIPVQCLIVELFLQFVNSK